MLIQRHSLELINGRPVMQPACWKLSIHIEGVGLSTRPALLQRCLRSLIGIYGLQQITTVKAYVLNRYYLEPHCLLLRLSCTRDQLKLSPAGHTEVAHILLSLHISRYADFSLYM